MTGPRREAAEQRDLSPEVTSRGKLAPREKYISATATSGGTSEFAHWTEPAP